MASETFDADTGDLVIPTLGGARAGAGRKPRDVERDADYADYGKARARNESAKAKLAELDLKVKTGEYVARSAVRQASATAMASLTQSLRSIPDNLERTTGLPADAAERVGQMIDAALNDLADEFELMSGTGEGEG